MKTGTVFQHVDGVARPYEVTVFPRTVFAGPHGSGKTTALRALELSLRGFVEELGPVPGRLPELVSPEGALTIKTHLDGRKLAGVIEARQAKFAPDSGVLVRTGKVPMTGTPRVVSEYLGKQLAGAVAAGMTQAKLAKAKEIAGPIVAVAEAKIMEDPIGALRLDLTLRRQHSKDFRSEYTRIRKYAEHLAIWFDGKEAPKSTKEIEKSIEAVRERRATVGAPAFASEQQRNAIKAADASVDSANAAIRDLGVRPVVLEEDAKILLADRNARDSSERALSVKMKAKDELAKAEQAEGLARKAHDAIEEKMRELERSLETAIGSECPHCTSAMDAVVFEAIELKLGSLGKELKAPRAALDKATEALEKAKAAALAADAASVTARTAADKASAELQHHRDDCVASGKKLETWEKSMRSAKESLAKAEAARAALPQPADVDDEVTFQLAEIAGEILILEESKKTSAEWESKLADLKKAEAERDVEKGKLDKALASEKACRDAINWLLEDPLGVVRETMDVIGSTLPSGAGEAIIELGDPGADPPVEPFFGFSRAGSPNYTFEAMSVGERACVFAILAAALIEIAPAEKKMLLIDTDVVGLHREALLHAIVGRKIDWIVVAFPEPRPSKVTPWPEWAWQPFPISGEVHVPEGYEGEAVPVAVEPEPAPATPPKRKTKKAQ